MSVRTSAMYASLGVEEYWLYDPTGERIRSRLCATRLESGRYRELAPEAAALEGRYLRSAVVGLDVRVDGAGELHVRNPVTGEEHLRPEEEHTRAAGGGSSGRARGCGLAGRGAGGGASGAAAGRGRAARGREMRPPRLCRRKTMSER